MALTTSWAWGGIPDFPVKDQLEYSLVWTAILRREQQRIPVYNLSHMFGPEGTFFLGHGVLWIEVNQGAFSWLKNNRRFFSLLCVVPFYRGFAVCFMLISDITTLRGGLVLYIQFFWTWRLLFFSHWVVPFFRFPVLFSPLFFCDDQSCFLLMSNAIVRCSPSFKCVSTEFQINCGRFSVRYIRISTNPRQLIRDGGNTFFFQVHLCQLRVIF